MDVPGLQGVVSWPTLHSIRADPTIQNIASTKSMDCVVYAVPKHLVGLGRAPEIIAAAGSVDACHGFSPWYSRHWPAVGGSPTISLVLERDKDYGARPAQATDGYRDPGIIRARLPRTRE